MCIRDRDMVLIESDNVSGGYQATNEMIKNGCKNIICFCPKDKGSTHIKRWDGYCKAMEETGGKPRLVSLDNVSEVDAYEKAIEPVSYTHLRCRKKYTS